jgi:acyl-CoA-dependent ceramide synthase
MTAHAAPLGALSNGTTHIHEMSLAVEEKALANEPRSKGGVSRSPQRPKRRNEDESLLASLCTLICNNQLGTAQFRYLAPI